MQTNENNHSRIDEPHLNRLNALSPEPADGIRRRQITVSYRVPRADCFCRGEPFNVTYPALGITDWHVLKRR